MNKWVHFCIQRIYLKKDYTFFAEKCKTIPEYYIDLTELAKSVCKEIKVCNVENDPCIELWLCFEKFESGEFQVEYRTLLRISKVADLFVFQHEFCVENKDINRTTSILDGFGEEAYTNLQTKAEDVLTEFLRKNNLQKLKLSEMDEVVERVDTLPESIFGSQMTVENALFRDLCRICED